MNETKKIEWKTENGHEVKITIILNTDDRVIGCSDWTGDLTKKRCEINTVVSVNDSNIGTMRVAPEINNSLPSGYVSAYYGHFDGTKPVTVGLSQDNHDRVLAAISELESTPGWIAKKEAKKRNEKIDDDYAEHCDNMRNAMQD